MEIFTVIGLVVVVALMFRGLCAVIDDLAAGGNEKAKEADDIAG